jgi:hypothetical protein
MKKLFLFSLIILVFFSCKKYKPFEISCTLTRDSNFVKQNIKGKWDWVESKSYFPQKKDFTYKTPKTERYKMEMLITDSILIYSYNGVTETFKYKVQRWGDVSGAFNFPEDELTTVILYNLGDGKRSRQFPVSMCSDNIKDDLSYVNEFGIHRIWKRIN